MEKRRRWKTREFERRGLDLIHVTTVDGIILYTL
jgi:hypothetical protein